MKILRPKLSNHSQWSCQAVDTQFFSLPHERGGFLGSHLTLGGKIITNIKQQVNMVHKKGNYYIYIQNNSFKSQV